MESIVKARQERICTMILKVKQAVVSGWKIKEIPASRTPFTSIAVTSAPTIATTATTTPYVSEASLACRLFPDAPPLRLPFSGAPLLFFRHTAPPKTECFFGALRHSARHKHFLPLISRGFEYFEKPYNTWIMIR